MKEFIRKFMPNDVRHVLALIIVLGVFTTLYIMLFKEIPKANENLVSNLLSFLAGGGLTGVIGYYFGASKTSEPKN